MKAGPIARTGALAALLAGCASAGPPPKELLDARLAMAQARSSPMAGGALAELAEAETAYTHAERTAAAHPSSDEARQSAYLARRLADRARLAGLYAADLEALAIARRSVERLEAGLQRRAVASAERARRAEVEERAREEQRQVRRRALREAVGPTAVAPASDGGLSVRLPVKEPFRPGLATFRPAWKAKLRALASALRAGPPCHIGVVVEEDPGDPASSGQDLARHRALLLRDALLAEGVPSDWMLGAESRTAQGAAVELRVVEQPVIPPPASLPVEASAR